MKKTKVLLCIAISSLLLYSCSNQIKKEKEALRAMKPTTL